MITLTYRPVAHTDFNTLRSLHWGLLKRAGWVVEYDNPIARKMCGVSATKQFNTLSEGVCEFEDVTDCDLNLSARYYASGFGSRVGRMLGTRMPTSKPVHRFTVTDELGKPKSMTGPQILRQIKSRFI